MGQNDACQLGNWRFKKLDFGCWGLILGGWVLFSQAQTFEILNEPRRWDFLRKPMIETTIIESVVGNIFPCDFFGWCFVESWGEIMNKTHAAYLADGWWLICSRGKAGAWDQEPWMTIVTSFRQDSPLACAPMVSRLNLSRRPPNSWVLHV